MALWDVKDVTLSRQSAHRWFFPLLSLIIFRQLWVCWFGPPSLTRGWVCNLQCNDASSISSYIASDGLSASSSWCRSHDQILISLFDNYFLSSRCSAPPVLGGALVIYYYSYHVLPYFSQFTVCNDSAIRPLATFAVEKFMLITQCCTLLFHWESLEWTMYRNYPYPRSVQITESEYWMCEW
jgi:hypothetical protein